MRTIAEPLLYAEASVDLRQRFHERERLASTRTIRWLETMQANPRLAALVRAIRVDEAFATVSVESVYNRFVEPIGAAALCCTKLERLDCAGAFRLRCYDFYPYPFPSQATLRSLDLFALRNADDWAFLHALPNLTDLGLEIGNCTGGPGEDEPRPGFRLENLRLVNDTGQRPEIGPDTSMFDALLHLSHESLVSLEMPSTARLSTQINLEQFPNLGSLSLNGHWSDERANDEEVDAAIALLGSCHALDGLVLTALPRRRADDAWRTSLPVILAAVPPLVTTLELSFVPSVALVDEILGWLPRTVKLGQLGVDVREFISGYPNEKRCAAECAVALLAAGDGATTTACSACARWAEEAQLWGPLEEHCAAKGIELIETEEAAISYPYLC
ncbi:hypothetical protein JCM9279_006699 [Rhodotorula babjevae]